MEIQFTARCQFLIPRLSGLWLRAPLCASLACAASVMEATEVLIRNGTVEVADADAIQLKRICDGSDTVVADFDVSLSPRSPTPAKTSSPGEVTPAERASNDEPAPLETLRPHLQETTCRESGAAVGGMAEEPVSRRGGPEDDRGGGSGEQRRGTTPEIQVRRFGRPAPLGRRSRAGF